MQKLHKTAFINASPEKVWSTMLNSTTYRLWTKAFSEGSHYEGKWEQGEKILFLDSGVDGQGEMGMVSMIRELRPNEFVSIEHIGIYKDGVEDTESEAAKKWAPAFENYTFIPKDGGTELVIDMDIEDEYKELFDEKWDSALNILKDLAEGYVEEA